MSGARSLARGSREQKRSFGYTFADLAVPGASELAGALFALSRDKGRLIQGPTDVHAHTRSRAALRMYARGTHSSAALRVAFEDVPRLEFLSEISVFKSSSPI